MQMDVWGNGQESGKVWMGQTDKRLPSILICLLRAGLIFNGEEIQRRLQWVKLYEKF